MMKDFIKSQMDKPAVRGVFNAIAPLHTAVQKPLEAFMAVAGPVVVVGAGLYLGQQGVSPQSIFAAATLAATGGLLTKQYTLPALRKMRATNAVKRDGYAPSKLTPAE